MVSSPVIWGPACKGEPSLGFWADPSLALASPHVSGLLGAAVVSSCALVSLTARGTGLVVTGLCRVAAAVLSLEHAVLRGGRAE